MQQVCSLYSKRLLVSLFILKEPEGIKRSLYWNFVVHRKKVFLSTAENFSDSMFSIPFLSENNFEI